MATVPNSPVGRAFTILLLSVGSAIVVYAVPMMTALSSRASYETFLRGAEWRKRSGR